MRRKRKKKPEHGPRGGVLRTSADGRRTQINIFLHRELIGLMDQDRGVATRRVWLERLLCLHFDLPEQDIA